MAKQYEDDFELLYMISENNEDANETLYKKYESAIDYYAKKYSPFVEGKGIDYNDLYQEGLIGLDSAIKGYKDQKDIKFSTFAFICIKRKIITAVKQASRKKHSILNESYSMDYHNEDDKNGFENVVHNNTGGIEDLLVSKENAESFNKMLNKELTSFEKQVYELRLYGFNYDEISRSLGKTTKSIESALFRIRIKLKNILDKINWLFLSFVLLST